MNVNDIHGTVAVVGVFGHAMRQRAERKNKHINNNSNE